MFYLMITYFSANPNLWLINHMMQLWKVAEVQMANMRHAISVHRKKCNCLISTICQSLNFQLALSFPIEKSCSTVKCFKCLSYLMWKQPKSLTLYLHENEQHIRMCPLKLFAAHPQLLERSQIFSSFSPAIWVTPWKANISYV